MTNVTLADIEAAHKNVTEMIAAFKAQAPRIVTIGQADVELNQGEHYAGILLGDDGLPSHHLILLPGEAEDVSWDAAQKFAADAGGELPTRREQSLLFANLKDQFQPRWYWSSEQHAAYADFAWVQHFYNGYQNGYVKSGKGRARAVRRLAIL